MLKVTVPLGEWPPDTVATSSSYRPTYGESEEVSNAVVTLGVPLPTVTTSFEHALEALLLLPSPG